MIIKRILLFSVVLLIGAFPSRAWGQNRQENPVIAEVGSDRLTMAELEAGQAAALFQARYQYYLAERSALDALIDSHLLQAKAKREGLTVEQLLDRDVNNKIKTPSEDDLKVFYETIDTEESFASVHDKLVDFVRQRRLTKAKTAYVKSLRNEANIIIALAPPSADVQLADAPTRGPKNAPAVLVEFADYECPYCQKVNLDIKKLQEEFGGQLEVAFKDFPLPIHSHAQKAAEAARCAGEQGKFWEYHDVLFVNNKRLEVADLKGHARALNLDTTTFDKCLDSGVEAPAVQKDLAQGQRLHLTGTPSFFINGHFISGAASYNTLREIVKQQLAAVPLPTRASN